MAATTPNTTPQAADVTECVVELLVAPTYPAAEGQVGTHGAVKINGQVYALGCLGPTSRHGYRLLHARKCTTYDVDTSTGRPRCDCPDASYRDRQCKHCVALVKLRKSGVI